jgi:multidrug efflux pump subunit AcrB
LNDFGQNFVRTQLATVQGAALAFPYGGKHRQAQVDINAHKLQVYGLSASDVVNAVIAQNIIFPAGNVKMGHIDYPVETNSAPTSIDALNHLPIKTVNGATIYFAISATSGTAFRRRRTLSAWTDSGLHC